MFKAAIMILSIITAVLLILFGYFMPAGDDINLEVQIMPISDLVSASFIERVGFPVAAALMFLYVIFWMIKKDDRRQEKQDERYTLLVNEFIATTKTMAADNQQALGKMTLQLQDSINLINSGVTKTQIRVSEMRKDIQDIMNRQRNQT